MRLQQICFRAHDPRWSFKPTSGDGAAIHGGRFNAKGTPALYLAVDLTTAIIEASQGFGLKIAPCLLCSYEVDCDDIVDLSSEGARQDSGISFDELNCAWKLEAAAGRKPASWSLADALIAEGAAGILVPSFAIGANGTNLVLWDWGDNLPHQVRVIDPEGQLPQNQSSWI